MRVVAVNVALTASRECLVAAVADPFSNEVFWTDGVLACRRAGGGDSRIRPDASSRLVDLNLRQ